MQSVDHDRVRSEAQKILKWLKSYGVDPFDTIFEMLSYDQMLEVVALSGFPRRFAHWRHGMEFEYMSKSHKYALQRVYEIVINNNPCYAYLLKSNSWAKQKMIMAHVYGHSDFFKNNVWFSPTNRHMVEKMETDAQIIHNYSMKHGFDNVESFIDRVLSIEFFVDYYQALYPKKQEESQPTKPISRRFVAKDYMESFVNPEAVLKKEMEEKEKLLKQKKHFPPEPVFDLFKFLMSYAPLESWERNIIAIIAEECLYFAPQIMTKIMNEGWATFWHSRAMTEKFLDPSELVEYASTHSGVVASAPNSLNPYKLGLELWRNIEERWNKGKFGKEYVECDNYEVRRNWDKKTNQGLQKVFEVRRTCNDVMFIDKYLTEDFCIEKKMFVYKYNPASGKYEISTRDFKQIKKTLLQRMTNLGHPRIAIVDGNFQNRGELLLKHYHDGMDLDLQETKHTMLNVHSLWKRPIHLETLIGDQLKILSYDGKEFKETATSTGV